MASIKFFNIKSSEERECFTEPMIAAFINCSDRSPNANKGQDMGWRLDAAHVVELKEAKKNLKLLKQISESKSKSVENVSESDILHYLLREKKMQEFVAADQEKDFSQEYESKIKSLSGEPAEEVVDIEKIKADAKAEAIAELTKESAKIKVTDKSVTQPITVKQK